MLLPNASRPDFLEFLREKLAEMAWDVWRRLLEKGLSRSHSRGLVARKLYETFVPAYVGLHREKRLVRKILPADNGHPNGVVYLLLVLHVAYQKDGRLGLGVPCSRFQLVRLRA